MDLSEVLVYVISDDLAACEVKFPSLFPTKRFRLFLYSNKNLGDPFLRALSHANSQKRKLPVLLISGSSIPTASSDQIFDVLAKALTLQNWDVIFFGATGDLHREDRTKIPIGNGDFSFYESADVEGFSAILIQSDIVRSLVEDLPVRGTELPIKKDLPFEQQILTSGSTVRKLNLFPPMFFPNRPPNEISLCRNSGRTSKGNGKGVGWEPFVAFLLFSFLLAIIFLGVLKPQQECARRSRGK